MDLNNLTMKSQAALQEAQQQAVARNHQTIEPEHVLFGLLGDPDGIDPTAQLTSLVSNVVDRATQEKIDVVKARLIRNYGYNESSGTDILNFVATNAPNPTPTEPNTAAAATPKVAPRAARIPRPRVFIPFSFNFVAGPG